MRLTIAYSKIKKRNLVLINNDTHQRETVSERPIRQALMGANHAALVAESLYTVVVAAVFIFRVFQTYSTKVN